MPAHNNGFQRIAGLLRDFQILCRIKVCDFSQVLCTEIPQPLKPNVERNRFAAVKRFCSLTIP